MRDYLPEFWIEYLDILNGINQYYYYYTRANIVYSSKQWPIDITELRMKIDAVVASLYYIWK